jgi:2-dehydro-3-deoxygalactonokinase
VGEGSRVIGVDWGTSSLRAFRLAPDGRILERMAAPRGIMHVERGQFAQALQEAIGPWLAAGETRVLLSGMVGSRQGWQEARYLPCPAAPADIAAALVPVPFVSARVFLVPGLSDAGPGGTPEVMRGEETQIVGVIERLQGDAVACLPGTHSKWARIEAGRIAGFATYLSGEAFSALREGTILGRMMRDGPTDLAAFDQGVARSGDAGHLLHHLFGVRTLGLFGRLTDAASGSYLSGLLIGHEARAARPPGGVVHIIGSAALSALYARALSACGTDVVIEDEDAAARGLALLANVAKDALWN